MAEVSFEGGRTCPKCNASFEKAEQLMEFDPVIVVTCPGH
jgi:hypothetical protein